MHLTKKGKILFYSFSLLMMGVMTLIIPLERIRSNHRADNHQQCPYYISLQSRLASLPLIAGDKANIQYIKNKLIKFEKDVWLQAYSSSYQLQYFAILKKFNLASMNTNLTDQLILTIAKSAYPVVDGFYLDNKYYCSNPLYEWKNTNSRRILRYNLNGLYDQIPHPYTRIESAVADDWLFGGSPPGLFVNNQSTTMDTRFMTGNVLLTALYMLPKFDFVQVGGYFTYNVWNYLRTNSFLDPVTRKVLDVGGIDVFTVDKADLASTIIPGTSNLNSGTSDIFASSLQTFINHQSYGLAYIANKIHYVQPEFVKKHEKTINEYFHKIKYRKAKKFMTSSNALYQELMKLENKHDIILETNNAGNHISKGRVNIINIIGERALFKAECLSESCTLVFNIATASGWHALVNGHDSKINRANFAFMSTAIPHGNSYIWFIYQPWSQFLSYFISILTLITILLVSIRMRYKHA